jgi:hypothetical protein
MKAKLIKSTGNHYDLRANGELIASTYQWVSPDKWLQLSKQNCDEIFGVFDIEKLADKYFSDKPENVSERIGFKVGFIAAMALNKDKLFTLEDVILIAEYVRVASQSTPNERTKNLVNEYLSSQPTEIEVVIVTETINDGLDEMAQPQYAKVPKLDSEGCLILKKI